MEDSIPSSLQMPVSSAADVPMEDDVTRPSILDELPARPPTPPKDKSKSTTVTDGKPPSSTPPEDIPNSSAENAEGQRQRRVNFSPYTDYHQPWKYDESTNQKQPLLRSILSSSEAGRPVKPILKPFDPPIISTATTEGDSDARTAFGELLESVCQALASSERTKKSDTYETFANTLRAYDIIPDRKMLAEKMALITSFIRRDFSATIPDVGTADTTLIKQANKVLTVFVWSPELVDLIPDDDVNYFVNHAIEILDQGTSKALSTMSLFFLNQQKLSSKFMTMERATKIIEVADNLTKKQQGTTVYAERISLYGRLLVQAKSAMIQNAHLWIDHIFQALLCSVVETRRRALTVATEMSIQIGHEKLVSRALNNLFPSNKKDETKKNMKKPRFIQDRLEEMLLSKDDAIYVPQIWGIIVSLLRGLTTPIDRWENFNPLLSIMSKCFNSSEQNLKAQAHLAWAKLIYASNINIDMSKKHLELLLRPIVGFIDEKKATRHLRIAKKAAIHNICTLMYYAFRPGASLAQVEYFWDILVLKNVGQYLLTSKNLVRLGCDILNGLFVGSSMWTENRGLQGAPITAEELPKLDPKWIRAKIPIVFQAMQPAFWTCLQFQDHSQIPHLTVWRKLMINIAESAKKEIRVSSEMMECVANLLNFLKQLWTEGFNQDSNNKPRDYSLILTHLMILVQLAIKELGTTCFTEKWLADDGNNCFTAISTPSGKSNLASVSTSNNSIQYPPLWHLFRLFIDPFVDAVVLESYALPIGSVLNKFVDAQDSRRKKISLLMQGLAILPTQDVREIHRMAWWILASSCARILPIHERNPKIPPNLSGPEIKDVLILLEWGYTHRGRGAVHNHWATLFYALFTTVSKEHGVGYLAPAVIDPIAEFMRSPEISEEDGTAMDYIQQLASLTIHSKVTVQYDSIRKSLFGDRTRKHTQESYSSLFDLLGQTLRRTSDLAAVSMISVGKTYVMEFLTTLTNFVHDTPSDDIQRLVIRLQDGLALWLTCQDICDAENMLAITNLLQEVCAGIQRTERFDSDQLRSYGHIIAAALENQGNKENMKIMLNFWNSSFGKQHNLAYPPRVQKALQNLRHLADISLPTFPESASDEVRENPPILLETQTSDFGQHVLSSPPRYTSSGVISSNLPTPPSTKMSRTSTGKHSHAKLRHMDSQIIYEPIYNDENDDPDAMESQLMTDHQKEVRARQAVNAEMFKDLNPALSSKRNITPTKVDLRISNPNSDSASETGQPSSPLDQAMEEFPPSPNQFTALMDMPVAFPASDDILSSPSTRFAKQKFVQNLDDIPSSPPLQPADLVADIIVKGPKTNGGTIDPRDVEISQGSKLRIEEGELPPHLDDILKSIPRSPREAIELLEQEEANQEKFDPKVNLTEEPQTESQPEDISMHLNSQVVNDAVTHEPTISSGINETAFSTTPEIVIENGEDDETVYSNVPDSPSSKLSGSRVESGDSEGSGQTKIQKRKRGRGRPRNNDIQRDLQTLDCIVVVPEEPEVRSDNPEADQEEEDEIEHRPTKKTKPELNPVTGSLRQLPGRTRRSILNRSVSDTGEFNSSHNNNAYGNSMVQNTETNDEAVQETKSTDQEKKPTTGTSVRTRRSRVAAASFADMTVPDSQSPRKPRTRRDSTASVASSQGVLINKETKKRTLSPANNKSTLNNLAATPSPSTDFIARFEGLVREMKELEFTRDELKRLDLTAFDMMHWVREKQLQMRGGEI